MRNIGCCGGSSICAPGPVSDVTLFFDCISTYTAGRLDRNWSLLTARLYRRYVRQDDLDETIGLMAEAKRVFGAVPSTAVDWTALDGLPSSSSRLESGLATLGQVFAKYFDNFDVCVASAKVFYESWKIYQPVRVGRGDAAMAGRWLVLAVASCRGVH
ncbi:hypothetical protein [Dyella sp. C9]|uniref:hypothetical protein n=1 Tax=Dyella sp. C9 TaxID=2202154 RepID=UPI001300980B|nr:hypothetical protein [Dyella sp. C9]